MPYRFRLLLLNLVVLLATATLVGQTPVNGSGQDAPREVDPLLRPDGKELFFTRTDYSKNKGTDNAADIWIKARYPDGTWGRALNPGSPINSFAHDRALAFSPDGTRLVVLRTGAVSYLELLTLSGRNWRILHTWPLPEGVAPRYDLTFDPNTLQLTYSAYDGGNLDLYRQQALPNGSWGAPVQLLAANSAGNEMSPSLAADGRTLYFRRNDRQWYRQDNPGQRPVAVNIPTNVRQFSVALTTNELIAVLPGQTYQKDYLVVFPAVQEDLPLPTSLVRGYLPGPPPPGTLTAKVALRNGVDLTVTPDALNRFGLFLRQGEALAFDDRLPALTNSSRTEGGLAASGNFDSSAIANRQQIEAGILQRQRELDRLDAERRKYDLVAPKTEDPELAALRAKLNNTPDYPSGQDTLPPNTSGKGSTVRRDRYAKELSELERMKAKFRKQQNEQLDERNRSSHQWSEKTAAPQKASPSTPAPTRPSIGEVYRPISQPIRTPEEQAKAYNDSLRIAAEVRAGLQQNNAPKVYERASWENEVRRGLPRNT
ncbi:MAG: hypothetical protein AAF840_08325, partial [Bacteroidota bacterium]